MSAAIANSHRTSRIWAPPSPPPRRLRPRGMLSADVDAFVDAVLAELAAMAADGTRPTRSGPKPPLTGAALRKAIMAICCVCFCGLQWRAIGQLCDTRSARCTRCSPGGPVGAWQSVGDDQAALARAGT